MNYEEYREKFFVDPGPEPRFNFSGLLGATLFFEEYEAAVSYYTEVLGPPAYIEGSGTRGWQIGSTWLTLLKGKNGAPRNVEIAIVMPAPADVEALQKAMVAAGGKSAEPSKQFMYVPVYACPVTDPFGTEVMIYSKLD